jgi:hypothetical protein
MVVQCLAWDEFAGLYFARWQLENSIGTSVTQTDVVSFSWHWYLQDDEFDGITSCMKCMDRMDCEHNAVRELWQIYQNFGNFPSTPDNCKSSLPQVASRYLIISYITVYSGFVGITYNGSGYSRLSRSVTLFEVYSCVKRLHPIARRVCL